MLEKIRRYRFKKQNLAKISEGPGVYIFWSGDKPLYVGKSVNLKSRIYSYTNLTLSGKTRKMISLTNYFSTIKVVSEIEALLLEAQLVTILKTPYNIQLKDDKHPLYIRITNDRYPQVITARKIDKLQNTINFFGPFPSSASVKKTLQLLRKIFPYSQHLPAKRACFYSQIGLCNPCPSVIEASLAQEKRGLHKIYLKNIKMITTFLQGDISKVKNRLAEEMKYFADAELFEEAENVKSQIYAIEYVTGSQNPSSAFLENPNFSDDLHKKEVRELQRVLSGYIKIKKAERIECYDVAHICGSHPAASMVTFINGTAEKKYYRHFKIYQKFSKDDISNLKEIAVRRKKHFKDWGKPDLILVDGGKGQVGAFLEIFKDKKIPVIGIAKKNEILVIPLIKEKKVKYLLLDIGDSRSLYLLQRLRNEAHRFAGKLHHKLIEKELFKIDG